MLIDQSYFTGPLTIAQLGQISVVNSLDDFIARYEPLIMEAALGYDFYQNFLNGIGVGSDEVTEQRWLKLLHGCPYLDVNGRRKNWIGFANGTNTSTVIATQRDDLTIYAGITPGFAVGGYQYINADLAGWNYEIESFGNGTLDSTSEWVYLPDGGWVLTDTNYTTQYNERFIIHFTGKKIADIQSGNSLNQSPVAGIVYYEYMRNLIQQNTGIGLIKANSENASVGNGVRGPVAAFNNAISQLKGLWQLLQTDQNLEPAARVYPTFKPDQCYAYQAYTSWLYFGYYDGDTYSLKMKNHYGI